MIDFSTADVLVVLKVGNDKYRYQLKASSKYLPLGRLSSPVSFWNLPQGIKERVAVLSCCEDKIFIPFVGKVVSLGKIYSIKYSKYFVLYYDKE